MSISLKNDPVGQLKSLPTLHQDFFSGMAKMQDLWRGGH
jgi:hypothetical protein